MKLRRIPCVTCESTLITPREMNFHVVKSTFPIFILLSSASSITTLPSAASDSEMTRVSINSTLSLTFNSPIVVQGSESLRVVNSNSVTELNVDDIDSDDGDDKAYDGSDLDSGSSMRFPLYLRLSATAICLLLLAIGCLGNLLVPYVVMKTKELRNSTNIFLMNLSVSDLMILLISSPTILIELHSQPETWFLGLFMCKAVSFVEICVAHVSILTILAISFERYYAICRPLVAGYKCTKRRALLIIIIIWLIAIISTLPMLDITELTEAEYIDGSIVTTCSNALNADWHPFYFYITFILFFAIPFVILLMLYCFISKRLTSDSKSISASSNLQRRTQVRRQVVMMLASVCVTFFVCLLPFRLMTLWIILSSPAEIEKIGMEVYYILLFTCRLLLYVNSSINPILYNVISSKFRCAFCKILKIGYWSPRRLRRRTSKYFTSNTYTYNNNNNTYNHPSHSVTLMNPLAKESTYSERMSDRTVINPLDNTSLGNRTISPPFNEHTEKGDTEKEALDCDLSKKQQQVENRLNKNNTQVALVIASSVSKNIMKDGNDKTTHNLPVAVHLKCHSILANKCITSGGQLAKEFVINSGVNINASELASSKNESFIM